MTQRCTFACAAALAGLAAAVPAFKERCLNQGLDANIQRVAMAKAE